MSEQLSMFADLPAASHPVTTQETRSNADIHPPCHCGGAPVFYWSGCGPQTWTWHCAGCGAMSRGGMTEAQGEWAWHPFPKDVQVSCCGNSVCPDLARALVEANCQHLMKKEQAA